MGVSLTLSASRSRLRILIGACATVCALVAAPAEARTAPAAARPTALTMPGPFASAAPPDAFALGATAYLDIGTPDEDDGSCSGVLIAPTRVLTAAHCLEGVYRSEGARVAVRLGVRRPGAGRAIRALSWKRAPSPDVYDVGTVELPAAARGEWRVTAPLTASTRPPAVGTAAWHVGYPLGGARQIHRAPIRRHSLCGDDLYPSIEVCAGLLDDDDAPCDGSSGGPLFVRGRVVGVLSGDEGDDTAECGGELPFIYTSTANGRVRRFVTR